jgi:hypothetical protein
VKGSLPSIKRVDEFDWGKKNFPKLSTVSSKRHSQGDLGSRIVVASISMLVTAVAVVVMAAVQVAYC